jgi:hypothetical protein
VDVILNLLNSMRANTVELKGRVKAASFRAWVVSHLDGTWLYRRNVHRKLQKHIERVKESPGSWLNAADKRILESRNGDFEGLLESGFEPVDLISLLINALREFNTHNS